MSQYSNVQQPFAEPGHGQWPEKPRDYDMEDSEKDFERWPKLAPVLHDCEITVGAAYRAADSTARNHHFLHKVAAIFAAFGGMFAVLFAIAQLPPLLPLVELPPDKAKIIEAAAAFVAGVAVVLGLWVALSKKWLVEREKAERCRFVKFGFLISSEAWGSPTAAVRQARLRAQLEAIEALDWDALQHLGEREDKALEATSPGAAARIDEAILAQLVDYYREQRLYHQLRYFERQAERRHLWNRLTRVFPFVLFFLSISAALGHFFYDVVVEPYLNMSHDPQEVDMVSLSLILVAACFPVVGAAVRVLRTAHEFGRNTLRFRVTSNNLRRLADDLQKPTGSLVKLGILHKAEKVLEAERREWLRLMIDAEWFG